jgi:hypothetical protein
MQIILSGLVLLLTEICKRVPQIPLNPANKLAVRGVGVTLSVVSILVLAYAEGQLNSANVINIAAESINTYLLAVLGYHGLLKK